MVILTCGEAGETRILRGYHLNQTILDKMADQVIESCTLDSRNSLTPCNNFEIKLMGAEIT